MKTPVVFRKWPNGDILALFPTLAADNNGFYCVAYAHVGQHGGADYQGCIRRTRPATESEYADLKAELERIGYELEVVERATRRMHQERLTEASYRYDH